MAFDEDVNLRVTAETPATEDLRALGRAASDAQGAVDDLDNTDVDIAIDDAQLPAVREALEEIRDTAERLDATDVTVDVTAPGLDGVESAAGRARTGLTDLSDAGDRTGSVMANVAGNAAQDIGEVAGVSGTAGIALGQMAEYASEGGIALSKIGPAAAGIGIVGIALQTVTENLQKQKEIDAWNTDRIDAYVEKIREGNDAAETLLETLLETEEIKLDVFSGGLPGGSPFQIDVVPILHELGLTVDDFTDLVGLSKDELYAFRDRMVDAGASTQDATTVIAAAAQEQERLATAAEISADKVFVFDSRTKEATRTMQGAKAAADQLAQSLVTVLTNLAAVTGASNVPVSTSRAMRGEGAIVNNFYPAAMSPEQIDRAQTEYQRVQNQP